ncbi:MAG TPA: 1-deoxy-D-xylulose-5-phosphate reductoisomerase [Turneriella sp.]|nr:1-deoxy-D-xylulose-5-phosphate reductoisomerase [Turneriella sp.]
MRRKFILFGATGSIGDSTLDILRQHSEDFELVGFTWHKNEAKASQIAHEFEVHHAYSTSSLDALKNIQTLLDLPHDFVLMAIVGAAGITATYEAAKRGKTILLANKESLVIAGSVINHACRKNGAKILPVDSEHSSLWRLLSPTPAPHSYPCTENAHIHCAYLTASGGPLLHIQGSEFENAPKSLVLKHPTWVMGQKITVDSAGLVNKALEVIEAHHLFGLPYEKIQAVIHPQSYVHAMIEHTDGTITQHVSQPDMRYPIAHAMYYPNAARMNVPRKEPNSYPALEFYPIDEKKFRAYALGRMAGTKGMYFPTVFNAANEVAVTAYLKEEIRFGEIANLIEYALDARYDTYDMNSVDGLMQFDNAAREITRRRVFEV